MYELTGTVRYKVEANPIEGVIGETNLILFNDQNRLWRKWEADGRNPDESPEAKHPFLYSIYDRFGAVYTFAKPDFVVLRDRNPDGSPNNIAVEVERSGSRKVDYYKRKLMMYRDDKYVYGKVVYLVVGKDIHDKVKRAAEEIGFDRIDIAMLMSDKGPLKADSLESDM